MTDRETQPGEIGAGDVTGERAGPVAAGRARRPVAVARARGKLARPVGAVRTGAKAAGRKAKTARRRAGARTSRLAAQVLAMAPRLPVRDRATLLAQFPGLSTEAVGNALIDSAARASAAVGGAVGAWSVLPIVPAFPVEVATETLALVAIEIKLVAELHEIYGARPRGSTADRMTAYVAAWAARRGVALAPGGLILAAGSPLRKRLQRRLAGRAGRSAVSLGPLLTGAAAGALLNRWETRRLGEEVHADLRRRLATGPRLLPGP
jgi:hypothetical protein